MKSEYDLSKMELDMGGSVVSIMKFDGYRAQVVYDSDMGLYRGDILGLNGGADFYGANREELREEFKKSLEVFFQVCKENGIVPIL